MEEKYKWTDKDGNTHEYRFNNDICQGFFLAGEKEMSGYRGKRMTDNWKKGLKEAGFLLKK